jgi:RNA polymerase sigma factor (sigma-70 family)
VLVRKAGSIEVNGSVGRWLFGVARRVATRAKADARRRRRRERSGLLERIEAEAPEPSLAGVDRAEVQATLAEELGKLPNRLQAPVILCDLEGWTNEEAARRLGWPVGTVKSRLWRARARLRQRLTRLGMAPPDLSIAMPMLSAALPHSLVEATTRAALSLSLIARPVSTAGVVAASVIGLTEGVLHTMFVTKLKLAAAVLFFIVTGSAVLMSQATAQKPGAGQGVVETTSASGRNASQSFSTSTSRDEELDVVMLERAWVDAIPRRDGTLVNRIMADDFEGIDPVGNVFTKSTYISDLRRGVFSSQPIELDEIKTRVYGDTAVVTSRIKISGYSTRGRMTNVYVKRQGRWQCVASHASGLSRDVCPVWEHEKQSQPVQPVGSRNTCVSCHAVNHQGETERPRPVNLAPPPTRALRVQSILAPFPCLVERVYVNAGEVVKNGDPLFDVLSIELAAAKVNYATARSQWARDKKLLDYRTALAKNKSIASSELTDAENHEIQSRLRMNLAKDKLLIFGLTEPEIASHEKEDKNRRGRMTIRSPVDGTVTEVGAELGNSYNVKDVLVVINPTSSAKPATP